MASHLLFDFENPDYQNGDEPYSAFKSVQSYFDDATGLIWVGVDHTIYSMSDLFDKDYTGPRIDEVSSYSFCTGSMLHTFKLIGVFPFAEQVYTADAAACTFATTCDLHINTPVLVRPCEIGDSTATLTIRASSTAPPLLYSLDNFLWKSSPEFTGLTPGDYSVYVKDGARCKTSRLVSIPANVSYGRLFYFSFIDSLGKLVQVDIFKQGYTGEDEEIQGAGTPLTFRERADGPFTALRGQECTINMIATRELHFAELFSGEDMEHLVNVHIDNEFFWAGLIVGDVYSEPYLAMPQPVSISATDGIGKLKDIPFHNEPPTGSLTQFQIVEHILSKLGHVLPYSSGLNIYETRMNSDTLSDPMHQAYVNAETFWDGKKVLDCATVLESILLPYGAYIRQYKGVWRIDRVENLKADYITRSYSTDGELVDVVEVDPTHQITPPGGGLFWVDNSQMIEVHPAIKQSEVNFDYGLRTNLIPGGSDISLNDAIYDLGWPMSKYFKGTAYHELVQPDPSKQEFCISVPGAYLTAATARYIQSERVWVEGNDANNDLSIYIKFEYKARNVSGPASGYTAPLFMFSVHLNNKCLQYPKGTEPPLSNGWITGFHQFFVPQNSGDSWQTHEAIAVNIPEDGWLTVRVYNLVAASPPNPDIIFKTISTQLFRDIPGGNVSGVNFKAINAKNYTTTPDSVDASFGDLDSLLSSNPNAPYLYKNIVNVYGKPAVSWKDRNLETTAPLLSQLANSMLDMKIRPVKVLRGALRGEFRWDGVLEEPDGTRYMPLTFEVDAKRNTISGEFMELIPSSESTALTGTIEHTAEEHTAEEHN